MTSAEDCGRVGHPAEVRAIAAGDVERIAALAGEIWRRHYPGIIDAGQIEYMLRQRYDPSVIRAELERSDVWWDKIVVDHEIIGFASCFLTGAPGEMKLDKLYIHHDHQRRGHGARLITHVCERARLLGCSHVTLAVNRNNRNAINAYCKHGFAVRASQVKSIGGGYVMDDYIMVREI